RHVVDRRGLVYVDDAGRRAVDEDRKRRFLSNASAALVDGRDKGEDVVRSTAVASPRHPALELGSAFFDQRGVGLVMLGAKGLERYFVVDAEIHINESRSRGGARTCDGTLVVRRRRFGRFEPNRKRMTLDARHELTRPLEQVVAR